MPGQEQSPDRRQLPLIMQLEINLSPFARDYVLCKTVNISLTGALVRISHLVPIASEVSFQLLLDEESIPVRGMAKVIRHSDAVKEGTYGMALNFESFDTGDDDRLVEFLDKYAPLVATPAADA